MTQLILGMQRALDLLNLAMKVAKLVEPVDVDPVDPGAWQRRRLRSEASPWEQEVGLDATDFAVDSEELIRWMKAA